LANAFFRPRPDSGVIHSVPAGLAPALRLPALSLPCGELVESIEGVAPIRIMKFEI
jgi:hypothetical protein